MTPQESLTAHLCFSWRDVLVAVGWVRCWIISKLTLWTFGHEHSVVVAFSVSGDFNSKELNPGGWKQERIKRSVAFVSLFKYIFQRERQTHQISYSPLCNLSHSPDGAECRSWNLRRGLQTGCRTDAMSATQTHFIAKHCCHWTHSSSPCCP